MKKIGILGSTGSIGTQTLDLLLDDNDFEIIYLSAYSNIELLLKQVEIFKPKSICIVDEEKFYLAKKILKNKKVEVLKGNSGLEELASRQDIDLMVNALVGYTGLLPTIKALEYGIDIALANKESLVVGGKIVMQEAAKNNTNIFPIDSEHSAIWQCMMGEDKNNIRKIILTGSGGPFRTLDISDFHTITREEALKHPNWEMGNKITIDSATMMNKGFEMIEAHWLFQLHPNNIEIVIHPQSIIHSMVEFIDGSIKAQLGTPNMTIPINFALHYPNRGHNTNYNFNFKNSSHLTFEPPDFKKFKCITLAYKALKRGGTCPAALNIANDLVVDAFLHNQVSFVDIPILIEKAIDSHKFSSEISIDIILELIDSLTLFIETEIGNV